MTAVADATLSDSAPDPGAAGISSRRSTCAATSGRMPDASFPMTTRPSASSGSPYRSRPSRKVPYTGIPASRKRRHSPGRSASTVRTRKIEPIEATGKHKYKAVVTKATCTTDGSTVYTCTVCGDSYVGKVVPAYGHTTQLAWYTTTKPTCGTNGEKSGYCRRCMEIVATEIIPATGRHQWSAVVVEPTETEPGYTEHTCQVCGQSYRDSETPPTGEN